MRKGPLSFRQTSIHRRLKKSPEAPYTAAEVEAKTLSPNNAAAAAVNNSMVAVGASSSSKPKKKAGGARLWMRFDRFGNSELIECNKSTIIQRVSLPARDLRILGPVFSHSSNILGN